MKEWIIQIVTIKRGEGTAEENVGGKIGGAEGSSMRRKERLRGRQKCGTTQERVKNLEK